LEILGDQEIRVALTGSESAYRRKLTRVPLKIPFVYSTSTDTSEDSDVSQEIIEAQTEDVSVGGLKFYASSPLTEGEKLQLRLHFSPSQTVKTAAVVLRSTASKRGEKDLYSIGAKFLELKSQEKEVIRRFLDHSNDKETSAEPAETTSILEVLRHPVRRSQVRR
jgi:c-di-GMP-binding flagellar brake protein YcgR